MRIVNEIPPFLGRLHDAGLWPNVQHTVFTFGETIYNPGRLNIPPDLMTHEKTHAQQQGEYPGGPDAWWGRYLQDKYFRIVQEVEAYGNQYRYICQKMIKDRNQRNRMLIKIGQSLSGPTYGSMITTEAAMQKVRDHAGV